MKKSGLLLETTSFPLMGENKGGGEGRGIRLDAIPPRPEVGASGHVFVKNLNRKIESELHSVLQGSSNHVPIACLGRRLIFKTQNLY